MVLVGAEVGRGFKVASGTLRFNLAASVPIYRRTHVSEPEDRLSGQLSAGVVWIW